MEEKPDIIAALLSSHFFAPAFPHPETWAAWTVFLKSLYGLQMDDDERGVFEICTGRSAPLNPTKFSEAYCLCGRRGGKSRISALIATFEALLGGWEEHLSAGENAWIFIIASDRAQAKIVLNYIKGLLQLFPDVIERETAEEIFLKNRICITVKTCSYRASRGFTTAVVICDEIAFWRDENSANPAAEIISSLIPGLLSGGLLLGISTPYARMGYLYEVWREHFGKSESDILVWQGSTKLMNSTYSQALLDKLYKRDRSSYLSEYEAGWREDVETFLTEEMIRAAMKHPTLLPPDNRLRYNAFIDPSGGRNDSMTMAICHQSGEQFILDRIEERRPPFDPAEVVAEFAAIMKAYGVHSATSDRYGGVWPESAFAKVGIRILLSDLSASDLYLEFMPLVAMGRVELINDERLLLQLKSLERRTRSGGKDQVDHGPGGHDDLSNAVAGAIVEAARNHVWTAAEQAARMPILVHRRELINNPTPEEEMRAWMGGAKIVRGN